MTTDYSALASDFYINLRVNLKMDLAMKRDTVLALFDRIRREQPAMDRFKRYAHELALESRHDHNSSGGLAGAGWSPSRRGQQWVAVRKTSVRSGSVNPESVEHGYALHKLVLDTTPYFLDITPLDIDHIELLYGFDLLASGNHDAIVFNALMGGSPLASLVDAMPRSGARSNARASAAAGARTREMEPAHHRGYVPVECQPALGVALTDDCDLQAHFEVKTRSNARMIRSGEPREEPISLYLVIRKYGPFADVRGLAAVLAELVQHGEELLDSCVIPKLLVPVREAIASGA